MNRSNRVRFAEHQNSPLSNKCFFPFHSSLINQPFNITQYELLAVSLYKTQVIKSICTVSVAQNADKIEEMLLS